MALSLLFGRPEPAKIGEIELDASLSEAHQFASDVTQFPVEDGSVITDHIQNKPDKLDINGFVTNTPVRLFGTAALDVVRTSGDSGRSELAFEALERLHKDRELVTIVTGLKTYQDMAMESLTVPRNKAIGDVLEFSASFVKVVKVRSAVVPTTDLLPVNGADKQGSSTADAGNQVTSAADDAQTSSGSTALRLFKGVLGVGG